MSFFSPGSDQPVDDGGCDDCGYDNRCHASLLCHNITRVGLSNRDCCFQNPWHGFRHGFAWFPQSGHRCNWSPTDSVFALVNRPAEIACHLFTVEVGLETGGASDTAMCQRFACGGEKSRLTPPNSNYTPKVVANRTNHRIDLVANPAQLANSLKKTK